MYPNKDGDNVTISPRIGNNKAEPTFTSSVNLEVLPGTTVNNDSMFVLRAVCHNCRRWSGGSLDVRSTAQPMIYAFGHGYPLYSDSQSANLKRHIRYGHFTMDMVAATGAGGVPANSTAISGVKMVGKMTRDHDRANLAHTIIGCLALFVIWPLNVLFAGFFKNIRIHVATSVVIMAFLIVAYALGISTSAQFNRVSCNTQLEFIVLANNYAVKGLQNTTSNIRIHSHCANRAYQPPTHPIHLETAHPHPTPPHASRLNLVPPTGLDWRSGFALVIASTPRYPRIHGCRTDGIPLHHDPHILHPTSWLSICPGKQSQETRRGR